MQQLQNQSINLLIPQYRSVGGAMMPISAPTALGSVRPAFSSIIIEHGKRNYRMATQNILFVRAENVYCEFFLCNKKRVVQRSTLTDVQQQLPPADFMRVHRSYLVNLAWVESWTKGELRIGESRIPVSRSRWAEVVRRLRERG